MYQLIVFDWSGTLSTGDIASAIDGVAPLFPEVPAMLNQLKSQGRSLAIATAMSKGRLAAELNHHGITDLFQTTFCHDQGARKPDPEVLFNIMATTGIPADKALMVGDTISDVACAHAAGVDSVIILPEGDFDVLIEQYQPKARLDKATDLPEWLEQKQ